MPDVGAMLGQWRRRCTNIDPTLGQCLAFAGALQHMSEFISRIGHDVTQPLKNEFQKNRISYTAQQTQSSLCHFQFTTNSAIN